MPEKYQNKYRVESSRLQSWDYGSNGAYFITICTHDRINYFGEIRDGAMILNEIGVIADLYYREIPEHFSFVELNEFVVMPNHVHGIIIINKPDHFCRDAINRVSTKTPTTTTESKKYGGFAGEKNPMTNENLSKIIRWYKGRTSFEIRKINPDFSWQPRFHDHIIKDSESLLKIRNYILNNPLKWKEDKINE